MKPESAEAPRPHDAPVGVALFARLLGPSFGILPPSVQRLHLRQGVARYAGHVEVERGRGWLSRLCAWATRLPPEGSGPIHVDITGSGSREAWTRHVGGHAMHSRLCERSGLLSERLGLVTFGFRLHVENGVLHWTVERVRALGCPLPAFLFGSVHARESEVDGTYRFDVRASLPGVGLLVHYRGWLDVH